MSSLLLRLLSVAVFLSQLSRSAPPVLAETNHPSIFVTGLGFRPLEGADLEYIELTNPGSNSIALEFIKLKGGIRASFNTQAVLEGRSSVYLVRNRHKFVAVYPEIAQKVVGIIHGQLSDAGESFRVEDQFGTELDRVAYGKNSFNPRALTESVGTLVRRCLEWPADDSDNWQLLESVPLTGWKSSASCEEERSLSLPFVINEIHYHAERDEDSEQEFVEIVNATKKKANLKGYSFDGISFTFDNDTWVEPGELVVVARNRKELVRLLEPRDVRVYGDFSGSLDNGGQRITLLDSEGRISDSVRYDDAHWWPQSADGEGRSIERIHMHGQSSDPFNWKASDGMERPIRTVSVSGLLNPAKLLLYMTGPGAVQILHVELETADTKGKNLISNADFRRSKTAWVGHGNHKQSKRTAFSRAPNRGFFHLVSTGLGGSGSGNNVEYLLPERKHPAWFSFKVRYRFLEGSSGLKVRIVDEARNKSEVKIKYPEPLFSPGFQNGKRLANPELQFQLVDRSPLMAREGDAVAVWAKTRGDVASMELSWRLKGKSEVFDVPLEKQTDGNQWLGYIPPQSTGSFVQYRLVAKGEGSERYEHPSIAAGWVTFKVHRRYVERAVPELHLYTDLEGRGSPAEYLHSLKCGDVKSAAVSFDGRWYDDVSVNRRGGLSCSKYIRKPSFRFELPRGHVIMGRREFNLNGLSNDESALRETLAWYFFRRLGVLNYFNTFVTLYVNDQLVGLYSLNEANTRKMLAVSKIDPAGWIYKSYTNGEHFSDCVALKPRRTAGGRDSDCSKVRRFLKAVFEATPNELAEIVDEQVDIDALIDYQIGQVLIENHDFIARNHFFYRNPETDRWRLLPWDMDFTFMGRYEKPVTAKDWAGGFTEMKVLPWSGTRRGVPMWTSPTEKVNLLLDRFFFVVPNDYYQRAYLTKLWLAIIDLLNPKEVEGLLTRVQEQIEAVWVEDWLFGLEAPRVLARRRDEFFNVARGHEDVPIPDSLVISGATAYSRQIMVKQLVARFRKLKQELISNTTIRQRGLLEYLKVQEGIPFVPRLIFTEILYDSADPEDRYEYVELWNPGTQGVDVSGWSITEIGFSFPENTVVDGNEVIVVARLPIDFQARFKTDVRVFGPFEGSLSNFGQRLTLKDRGPGYPASIDEVSYERSSPWPFIDSNSDQSITLRLPRNVPDNAKGEHWVASTQRGGMPGVIDGKSDVLD